MTQTTSNPAPESGEERAPEGAEFEAVAATEADTAADAEPETIDAAEILDPDAPAYDAQDMRTEEEVGVEAGPEERIQILEAQVAALNDKLLRSMAEMENVRRRAQREKEDASKFAIANFAKEMLVVSDNMTRAFASIEGEGKGVNAPAEDIANQFAAFIEGVRLTESDLMKTLEKLGLQRIDPLGQKFDANLHEALFEFEDKNQVAGTVAQVLETGYTLNGRLLRAAKVGITKGGPKSGTPQQAAQIPPEDGVGTDSASVYDNKSSEPGSQIDEEL